jgi:hypothetical protein
MKTPAIHPRTCALCGDDLIPSPKGQRRLYCPADVRPCKERARVLKELAQRVEAWDADGRPKVASAIRERIETLRSEWQLPVA